MIGITGNTKKLYKISTLIGAYSMLNSITEIQQFIEWCKENKVKSFNNNNISFELSDLAFIEEMTNSDPLANYRELPDEVEDDEELLFHSTNL